MELFVALTTLLISLLFTVEVGLMAGICANIVHLALMWSRPKLKIELVKVSEMFRRNTEAHARESVARPDVLVFWLEKAQIVKIEERSSTALFFFYH